MGLPFAENQGLETGNVEYIDEAVQQAEANRFEKLVRGTTPHVEYILRALGFLIADNPEVDGFKTNRIYELYKTLADREGAELLSEGPVYRLLKEQLFLGVTESSHPGRRQGEGSYLEHRLVRDAKVVVKAIAASGSEQGLLRLAFHSLRVCESRHLTSSSNIQLSVLGAEVSSELS